MLLFLFRFLFILFRFVPFRCTVLVLLQLPATVQVEPSVSIRSKSMSSGAKSLTPADVALITVETPSKNASLMADKSLTRYVPNPLPRRS